MITGKNSALKGLGLLFYALITILVLVCTCISSLFWGVVGIINAAINGWIIISLYRHWSKEGDV